MGEIQEQHHPASSVDESERPIRQRPGIRVGGGLVNHLTPKKNKTKQFSLHSNYHLFHSGEAATGGALSKAIA
jgi:hypothetical protein